MMTLSLKNKLAQGNQIYGMFNSIPNPLVTEIIAASGYDFVIIDSEHTAINEETLEHMIRAAEAAQITPIVRVSQAIERDIIKVLDMGARGIVVPHVTDKEKVEQVVQLSRYYPQGLRSLNGGRMAKFGEIPLTEYMKDANNDILVIAMIEDKEGIAALEDIVQVDGLDMIIEGAADLSQSFGMPWETTSDTVQSALRYMHDVTQGANKYFCALPRDTAQQQMWLLRGVNAFVLGDERGKLYRHLKSELAVHKGAHTI
ncbi:siderophore biosynthesis protein SbnG [Staphylococcus arlettae]|uniref:HpcH/HpaI aldolase family protein n=1 Tax=Staphylococcus TaxID=1279 RepID=UPI000D1C083A|nr:MULTISPECIES: HpcH/HpaI aldolase/citrate lyase family protein [Staphylococcus]MBF0737146.1 HpcH/HpaI aldolase/citrate lyase family protein [Staphylococcus arlettae]MCD8838684.1 HpcH/HpaI aldolase/citrate lyase family protein [Staphylococcus arlettae]MCD8866246.1 HpcH/HpaI aldolase/citrate lyase family protein [Staphylococcus arlettae]MCD8907565.1 HpcH/HpaI aldolase/citrate lyase family protein [Staphylococcus arlettae]PTH48089.1 siderophore biosynthesis protein SbnG [Staphylococcus arlettae